MIIKHLMSCRDATRDSLLSLLSYYTLLFFLAVLSTRNAHSQVLINEVSSKGELRDEEGKERDWIELFNAGFTPVDLSDYYLSDELADLDKWQLPAITLAPEQFVTIAASGKDRRQYIDRYEGVVFDNDLWSYFGGSEPPSNWFEPGFDASAWPVAPGGFGYGDGDDATTLPGIPSVYLRKTFTVLDTAEVGSVAIHIDFDDGCVAYLNGVEVFRENLTGLPPAFDAEADESTEALLYTGEVPESVVLNQETVRELLVPGNNTFCVQVNNVAGSSDLTARPFLSLGLKGTGSTYSPTPVWFDLSPSDYYPHTNFKLSAEGEFVVLSDSAGTILDQINPGRLETAHSYGRSPDGANNFCVFTETSPGESNNGATCYKGYEPEPVYSVEDGFYPGPQSLIISTTSPTAEVRYTIDGSEPDESSALATGPLMIPVSSVIQARSFSSINYLPSRPESRSYFIGEGDISLPVFSITTDPVELFDPDDGIYFNAEGGDDGGDPDNEIDAHLAYYDKNGTRQFEKRFALQMHGGGSLGFDQKSFRIDTKEKIEGDIEYPLFADKPDVDRFNNVTLRNGGNENQDRIIADAFMQRAVRDTDADYLSWEPAVAFVNGNYFGFYGLREKQDEFFLESNYGVDPDEVDILTNNAWTATGNTRLSTGSDTGFIRLRNFIENIPPSSPDFYAGMSSQLDVSNYTDYFVTQIHYQNGDWLTWDWFFIKANNTYVWREQEAGAKWRYGLWDLDFGLGGQGGSVNDNFIEMTRTPALPVEHNVIFNRVLDNAEYRTYFINRYADMLNTTFQPARMQSLLEDMRDSMVAEMPRHLGLLGMPSSVMEWESNLYSMLVYNSARIVTSREHLRTSFGLTAEVDVTLNAIPPEAGKVQISTVVPESLPWTGVYFNGNPVTITALPNPGYVFDFWEANPTLGSTDASVSLTLNIAANESFVARFQEGFGQEDVAVTEINYNQESTLESQDWFELYNRGEDSLDISGWLFRDSSPENLFVFPAGTRIAPEEYLVVVRNDSAFNSIYPGLSNVVGSFDFGLSNGGDQIGLADAEGNPVLEITFDEDVPWPIGPDGWGRTLELIDPDADLSAPDNWRESCIGGTPGAAPVECTPTILVSEINYNSEDSADAGDWIELYNPTSSAINIGGFFFRDDDDDNLYTFPPGTTLNPDAYLVVFRSALLFNTQHPGVSNKVGPFDFGLSGSGDAIRLYDNTGLLLEALRFDDGESWPQEADGLGATLEYTGLGSPNEGASWIAGCAGGSPGEAYDFSCSPCLAPEALSAEVDPVSVELGWAVPAGADAYQVQGRPLGTASFAGLYAFENSLTVGGLTPETSYEWMVRARCVSGEISAFSALDTFTTPALRVESVQALEVSLFPNPATTELYLVVSPGFEGELSVEVVDLHGRVLDRRQFTVMPHMGAVRMDLSALPVGVYNARMEMGASTKSARFVVAR